MHGLGLGVPAESREDHGVGHARGAVLRRQCQGLLAALQRLRSASEFGHRESAIRPRAHQFRIRRQRPVAVPKRLVEAVQFDQGPCEIGMKLGRAGIDGQCAPEGRQRPFLFAERAVGDASFVPRLEEIAAAGECALE
ncbi:hypothetical protein D9M68_716520 [compost metagenome]